MPSLSFGSEFSVSKRKGTQESSTTRGLGDVSWTTSSDHTSNVSHYEGKVYDSGSTLVKTIYLGKPGSGDSVSVRQNIAGVLNALAAGDYTVHVFAVNGDGSTDSSASNTFTVPLTPEP